MKQHDWTAHLRKGHKEINGVRHDLRHLREDSFEVEIAGNEKHLGAILTISVGYSSHCVSKGPMQGQVIDFASIGEERRLYDHRSIARQFAPDRHALSVHLPRIIRQLPERQCLFTGHQNYLTIDSASLGLKAGAPYEIYFNIRLAGENAIKLYVESAYVRDANADRAPVNFKQYAKIKGWLLLLKKARGDVARKPESKNPQ